MELREAVIQAWHLAASDLGIRVSADGALTDEEGRPYRYAVHVPDFGGPNGAICTVVGDDDGERLHTLAIDQGFHFSVLYQSYAEYDRTFFAETLDDWQWFGEGDPPAWYTGTPWTS